MNRFKISAIVCSLIISVLLSACGGNSTGSFASEPPSAPSSTVSSASSATEEVEPSIEASPDEELSAPQEDQAEPPAAPSESDSLSSDILSFQFQLDGVVYKLPAPYSQFADNGWTNESFATASIRPSSKSMGDIVKNGKKTITLYVTNTGKDEVTYDNALVCKIMLDGFNAKNGAELIFPNGITVGSTQEQVLSAYGEPTSTSETGSLKFFYYEKSTYSTVKIVFDADSGTVTTLEMENIE